MFWAARALQWQGQRVYHLGRKVWVIFGKPCRAGDRSLQLLIFNEEFLVSVSHQLALTTSLLLVHTARRSYRLNDPVKFPEQGSLFGLTLRQSLL